MEERDAEVREALHLPALPGSGGDGGGGGRAGGEHKDGREEGKGIDQVGAS